MKVVSLFSGAGGLDMGFIWAGHKVVWANDNFPDAVETYKTNIGNHVRLGPIEDIPSEEIPGCDVVVGGFPCQGFSVANWTRKTEDPRNRLYLEMCRVVRDKQPRFFVAENVRGLVSIEKGRILEMIKKDFSDLGYNVSHVVLNSANYGVPQKRIRVFLLGTRKDLRSRINFPPAQTHHDPSKRALVIQSKPWVSVGEALKNIPEEPGKGNYPNHTCSNYKLRFNGYLGHRRIDPSQPSPTVTARGDDKGGVVILHHPSNKRRMTVRELATVQSFPLNYVFEGCQTSAYRQIGNAVPPLLAKAVAGVLPKK